MEEGGEAIFVKTDVSQANQVETLVSQTLDKYGRLDCAVNNAAIRIVGSVTAMSEADSQRAIEINLKGV